MRDWLAALVGESLAPIVTVILAAAVVILLALVLIGLAKRVFAGTGGIGSRTRAPRLAILDVTPVDPKRKLVLIRRDEVEHLLLIGGQNDFVVEQGILRGQIPRRPRPDGGVRHEPEVERGAVAERAPTPPMPQRRVPQVQPAAVRQEEALDAVTPPQLQPVVSGPAVRVPEPRQHARPAVDPAEPREAADSRSQPRQAVPEVSLASPEATVSPSTASSRDDARASPARDEALVPAVAPDMVRRREAASVVRPVAPPIVTQVAPPVAPPVASTVASAALDAPKLQPQPQPQPQPSVTVERAAPTQSQRPSEIVPASAPVPDDAAQMPSSPASSIRTPIPAPPAISPAALRPSVQPPVQHRSMATPTLPVAPNAPVVPPVDGPTSTPARSLWAAAPTITVGPIRPRDESDRNSEGSNGAAGTVASAAAPAASVPSAPEPATSPIIPPVFSGRGDDDRRGEAPVVTPTPAVETPRQPLSVKSFATTIQSRRTPVGPLEGSNAGSAAEKPRNADPVRDVAPPVESRKQEAADEVIPEREPSTSSEQATPAPRPLTLEEEMERLLHDFTIDVSERR